MSEKEFLCLNCNHSYNEDFCITSYIKYGYIKCVFCKKIWDLEDYKHNNINIEFFIKVLRKICEKHNLLDNPKQKIITCYKCNCILCKKCCEEEILNNYCNPICPKCKRKWNIDFLKNNFSKEFINELSINHLNIFTDKIKRCGHCKNCSKGILYEYNNQIICNNCNLILCNKCHINIYPLKKEFYNIHTNEIDLIDNPLYSSYTKEQKEIKHICNESDIEVIKKIKNYYFECPNCGDLIYKQSCVLEDICFNCGVIIYRQTKKIYYSLDEYGDDYNNRVLSSYMNLSYDRKIENDDEFNFLQTLSNSYKSEKEQKKQKEINVLDFKKQNELNNYISLILYSINYYYHLIY